MTVGRNKRGDAPALYHLPSPIGRNIAPVVLGRFPKAERLKHRVQRTEDVRTRGKQRAYTQSFIGW